MRFTQTSARTGVDDQDVQAVTDRFIHKRLPGWITEASAQDINELQALIARHKASQDAVNAATAEVEPLDRFAIRTLSEGLASKLPVGMKLSDLEWQTKRREQQGVSVPYLETTYQKAPALHRLMQNFAEGATPLEGSGLVLPGSNEVLSGDLDAFIKACRTLDAGEQYQTLLRDTFGKNKALLVADKRAGFALAVQVASLKHIIDSDVSVALRTVIGSDAKVGTAPRLKAYPGLLSMLGVVVHEALLVQLRDDDGNDEGVVVYLPADPQQPLRRYDSMEACEEAFVANLQNKQYLDSFLSLIALEDRSEFYRTLQLRLQDAVPDLELEGKTGHGHVIERWVDTQIARVEADAKLLLVPTAQADAAASKARWAFWRSVGWDVVNLAGFFIPVVGAVLLTQLVVEVCADVFEGVRDWAKGHDHEALGHALNVAETAAAVAVTAGVVVGAGTAVEHFTRSAFVDGLDAVGLDDGTQRLWNNELSVYQSDLPEGAALDQQGRYTLEGRHWVHVDDHYYEIHRPQPNSAWRLRHPQRDLAYGPVVRYNSERFWHLQDEAPISWSDPAQMLGRLWPQWQPLDQQRAQQVLQVAGSDVDELRGILVENRALPANLRDTLRRFEASERIDRFYASLAPDGSASAEPELHTWCLQEPALANLQGEQLRLWFSMLEGELRQGLFQHLTAIAPSDDPAVQLIVRDFPGLPADYAMELACLLTAREREEIELLKRLPLSVTTQARGLLQLAKSCRVQQGLVLRNAYNDDCSEVLPFLLSRLPNWPSRPRLELRQGSWTGRLLGVINSSASSDKTFSTLVHENGSFNFYGERGDGPIAAGNETDDVFQAIVDWVKVQQPASFERMGNPDAAELRRQVVEKLPKERQGLFDLFGWRREAAWFNPGQRLPDGRVGYPLGGAISRRASPSRRLRRRVEVLYHGDSAEGINRHLYRILDAAHPFEMLAAEEDNFLLLNNGLDAWITDLPEGEKPAARNLVVMLRAAWRSQLPADIYTGAGGGYRLDLSGCRISNLPELHAHVDFDHISTLVMINTPLQTVPESFFGCLVKLRRLNMSNNQLTKLPDGLRHLRNLEHLSLASNRIRLDEQGWNPLSSMARLMELDLKLNPLRTVNLDFGRHPLLRRLVLSYCGLTQWPQGLEACNPACRVDLRHNNLSSVPGAIMQMPYPFRSSMQLIYNAIPVQDLLRFYAPPAHLRHPQEAVADEAQALRIARQLWVPADQEAERGALWDRLFANANSDGLRELLGRLQQSADYENALFREGLDNRVWELLEALNDDSDLLDTVLLQAGDVTCADNVIERFSELYLQALVSKANRAGAGQQSELLKLGKGMFRLTNLKDFINAYIIERRQAGGPVDEVEVNLFFQVELAERLGLPGVPKSMRFAGVAQVPPSKVSQARLYVLAAESQQALASYLSEQAFWSTWLEREHPQAFEEISTEFDTKGSALDSEQDTLTDQEYKERWEALAGTRTARLLQLKIFLTRNILEQPDKDIAVPAG